MNERAFLSGFMRKLKKRFPKAFVYKIPDTKGLGGMRPFDLIVIHGGETYCIEAKRGKKSHPTPYQQKHLDCAAANGATSLLLFPENAKNVLDVMEDLSWNR